MTRKLYIVLFVVLGLLLGPTQTYAAVPMTDTVMSCCAKETATKDCCKEKGHDEQKHQCDSSCVGTSCGCPSVYCGSTLMFFSQTTSASHFDLSERQKVFFYSEIFISSDFRSIWLPPKIA